MQGTGIDEQLHCAYCGDVIGAYEPLVVLLDGRARSTSKAAETDNDGPLGECYHRACFERKHDQLDEPAPGRVLPRTP
jgi:hypothetical protein